jgi:protein SCO1/2
MPRRPRLAPLALAVALTAILGGCGQSAPSAPSAATPQSFEGAALPADLPSHDFTLTDQDGRRVALADYRGQAAILTFLTATPTGVSPLVAQQIRGALDDLGRAIPALAVSANPRGDSPARVRAFLRANSLAGRLEYLTGTPAQLRAIWRVYRVVPAGAGKAAFERAATVLLIDRRGRERVVFGLEQLTPEALAHDIRALQAEAG